MKTARDHTLHEVLRAIPYGLHVLGVRGKNEDELNAIVVSWVTQCSFEPPLLLVAVRRQSRTFDLLSEGMTFTLNLIDKSESEIARQLVRPADMAGNKLGQVGHLEEETGAPVLRKAFAFVECRVMAIYEPGDHALVVGEPVNAGLRGKGEALLCSDMHWHYAG